MPGAVTADRGSEVRAFSDAPYAFPPSKKGSTYINSSGDCRRVFSSEIASKHLSSSLLSSSKHNSSCLSAAFTSPSSSSSSSSSSSPRRFPSPLQEPVPNPSTLPQRRSQSVHRMRPFSEGSDSNRVSVAAARSAVRTTVRRLPVSFQTESFFFQTSKAKPAPVKPITELRKSIAAFAGAENSQLNVQKMRQSAAREKESNLVSKSLEYSVDCGKPILMTVRLLLDKVNSSVDDRSQSQGSERLSSVSISSSPEPATVKLRTKSRGICVPARFRQENGSPRPHIETPQKVVTRKQQQLPKTQLPSHIFLPSPLSGSNPSSAKNGGDSKARRNIMTSFSADQVGNAPSIISFASVVRRTKKGESRIEDAHMLRLFDNRYLQWRYINSLAENTFLTQLKSTKDNLYNAWISISELHDSAMNKKIQLQILQQNLKLSSTLEAQIAYLDELSTVAKDHEISVREAIVALEASTLRLPVIEGAKVDIREVKHAVGSAIGVMQEIAASMCSSLSKVEETSSLLFELSKTVAFECSLLNQSRDLFSMVAALHVKQCSLQGCIIQLGRKPSLLQLQ